MPRKFTIQQKEAYIAQFYKTHLTQTEFCKQQGLTYKLFNRWLSEARFKENSSALEPEVASLQPHFIPIECLENNLDLNQVIKETSQDTAPTHQHYQSKLCVKVNAFELEMSLDLLSDEGQSSFKNMISILGQVNIGQCIT
jgi:hypothetical protein